MDRRQFLLRAALAPLAAALPGLVRAAPERLSGPRFLVLVELSGGNDGLNTVVPFAQPGYYRLRPTLAVARAAVLPLDRQVGLNPALAALMPAFEAGNLAVVQGLGYPGFNRSHFRSIDIWDTGSGAEVIADDGWLTRAGVAAGPYAAPAIVIGRNPGPVMGAGVQPVVMANARSFVSRAKGVQAIRSSTRNAALKRILEVQAEIEQARLGLNAKRPAAPGSFPRTPFGRDLAEAASLLAGTPATTVVKVSITGFDHHVRQRSVHDHLLRQLAEGLAALRASLMQAGIWQRTLVMTYSEFGRRAQENASQGTDHGKAAPHFVLGGAIRGGVIGQPPDLQNLDDGDVRVTLDYRQLYNGVLGRWWKRPDAQFQPALYPPLPLV